VVRQGSAAHDSRAVVAACMLLLCLSKLVSLDAMSVRLAGFRLMEAGLEPKPDIEGPEKRQVVLCCRSSFIPALLHILRLASKTGATLSGAYAGSLLRSFNCSPYPGRNRSQ